MICPNCRPLNAGGDPHDHGCRVCGVDMTDENYQAEADENADRLRRDKVTREDE